MMGWANKWQMEFNPDKCKVLHLGKNDRFAYEIGGTWLESTENQRDLGVIINQNLEAHDQCLEARNRANMMLSIINRNVTYVQEQGGHF